MTTVWAVASSALVVASATVVLLAWRLLSVSDARRWQASRHLAREDYDAVLRAARHGEQVRTDLADDAVAYCRLALSTVEDRRRRLLLYVAILVAFGAFALVVYRSADQRPLFGAVFLLGAGLVLLAITAFAIRRRAAMLRQALNADGGEQTRFARG